MKVVRDGNRTSITSAITRVIMKGTRALTNSWYFTLAILNITKIPDPTGGVIIPIMSLKTITTPKWRGSMPKTGSRGIKMGIVIISVAMLGIKHPFRR